MGQLLLNLTPSGISPHRQRELQYFCYQYREKRQLAAALLSPGATDPSAQRLSPTSPSDPTAYRAARREHLLADIEDIELAAQQAALGQPTLARALLLYTTGQGCRHPEEWTCGRRQFYAARRRFFLLLNAHRLRRATQSTTESHTSP